MYRWIEHTSEVELELEAASERGVFEAAVNALAELLDPERAQSAGPRNERRTVTVQARFGDRAALLAGWLEELVFLAESEGFVATSLAELELELAPGRLTAVVAGWLGHPPALVKAVTLHRLGFEPHEGGYLARVVLDV